MSVELKSHPEQRALVAEDLSVFQGVKLLHIKNIVAELLAMIGREKLFAQYSKHDISHIDAMLALAEWVIPEPTKEAMTPTDWLMLVLSIYLHDMGMVVTRNEYESRPRDRVEQFKSERLFVGEDAADYEARIGELPPDEQERFVYEEFIRETHGQRIREWLDSQPDNNSSPMHHEIAKLAEPLPTVFRVDLGLVCESHHLDDLGNLAKYALDKPYGNTPEETANLQYVAVVLRSVDLLHITADRTPPVLFRIINPTDPLSQREWLKQGSVRTVRKQVKTDRNGNVDESAQPDTVEVFAQFEQPEGFFALTAYLTYAEQELQRSNDWVSSSRSKTVRPYEFPWRRVDDTEVEAKDYLPQPYEFTIDQGRVLKLLTGHTLYNRTDVVVRELIQNSLDAVRLQALGSSGDDGGEVLVEYDSQDRLLRVTDDGTGMTQGMIERHLLRVGSSRYQDPEFRKEYPDFSPISRFGIGVLSAFMVADRVEILTAHPDEEGARELALRTVRGKYLMRPVDTEDAGCVLPHGTRFSLWLRPSAELGDIVSIVKKWIVIPRCSVKVVIDGGESETIGYGSAAEALKDCLKANAISVEDGKIEVRETERNGVQLAWAVRWSDYFRNWSVFGMPEDHSEKGSEKDLGLCVEGVRVEEGTPGFQELTFAAIANATGPQAPKTNVARSGLEQTPQRLATLAAIYSTICGEVTKEIDAMVNERELSITWATQEARWCLWPIYQGSPRSQRILYDSVKKVPTLLREDGEKREAVSPAQVEEMASCWTVESNTFASAERMLRELAVDVSVASLKNAFGSRDLDLPEGPLITGYQPMRLESNLAFSNKEVAEFVIKRDQRRVDLRWEDRVEDSGRWRMIGELVDWRRRGLFDPYIRSIRTDVSVASTDIQVAGADGDTAIKAFGRLFVLPGSPVTDFVNSVMDRALAGGQSFDVDATLLFIEVTLGELAPQIANEPDRADQILERVASIEHPEIGPRTLVEIISQHMDLDDFANAIRDTSWTVFDPGRWLRQE